MPPFDGGPHINYNVLGDHLATIRYDETPTAIPLFGGGGAPQRSYVLGDP